jgi:hypothetical protein
MGPLRGGERPVKLLPPSPSNEGVVRPHMLKGPRGHGPCVRVCNSQLTRKSVLLRDIRSVSMSRPNKSCPETIDIARTNRVGSA